MWKSHVICSISLLCHVPIFWACKCGSHMSSAQYLRGGVVWHLNTSKEKLSPLCLLVHSSTLSSAKTRNLVLVPCAYFLEEKRVRCGSHMSFGTKYPCLCHVPFSGRANVEVTCHLPNIAVCLVPNCHSDFVICKVVCKEKRHAWTHIKMEQKITWKHTKGKTKLKVISLWFSSVFWLECYFSTILLH